MAVSEGGVVFFGNGDEEAPSRTVAGSAPFIRLLTEIHGATRMHEQIN